MKPISNAGELKQAIADLEKKKVAQQAVLKEQYQYTKQLLKPVNLVKNGYSKLAAIPEVRRTLINTIIGFGLGYFSKKASRFLSEQSMDRMMNNLVDLTANHLIERDPTSFLAKGVHLARNAVKENVF